MLAQISKKLFKQKIQFFNTNYFFKSNSFIYQTAKQNKYPFSFNNISKSTFYNFSTKKQNPKANKQVNTKQKTYNNQQQQSRLSESLWKFNALINFLCIGAGFYFPQQSLQFLLMFNSISQMYIGGSTLDKFQQLVDKSQNCTQKQNQIALFQVKKILKKILINNGALFITIILVGTSSFYPQFNQYALLSLGFWILYNLKFNNFSHGYYFVIITLILFQYFYLQNFFKQNKKQEIKSQSF